MKVLKHAILSLLMLVLGGGAWFGCQDKIPPVGVIPNAGDGTSSDSTVVVTIRDAANVWVPQEICGGSGGGGGGASSDPPPDPPAMGTPLSGWKFAWRDPSSFASISGNTVTTFAQQNFLFDAQPASNTTGFRPIILDQNNQAEQLALAKAIVCVKDATVHTRTYGNDTVTYYDEVWHAIRYALSTFRTAQSGNTNCGAGWPDICNNGWIGMARNVAGYAIAADYLMSLGPPDYRGYKSRSGQTNYSSPVHNYLTYDSLRVFVDEILGSAPALEFKAPTSCRCRDQTPTPAPVSSLISMLDAPDNKGAAALASYAVFASLNKNMSSSSSNGGNPLLYKYGGVSLCDSPYNHTEWCTWNGLGSSRTSSAYTTAVGWMKAWQGKTSDGTYVFKRSQFDNLKNAHSGYTPTNWANTWLQGDSLYNNSCCTSTDPIKPLKMGDKDIVWPTTNPACSENADSLQNKSTWGAIYVKGMPVDDMLRAGSQSGFDEPVTPKQMDWAQVRYSATCALRGDTHVSGTAVYLLNLVNIIWQQDGGDGTNHPILGGNIVASNDTILPRCALFYERWADKNPNDGMPDLKGDGETWPATYLLKWAVSNLFTDTGVISGRAYDATLEGRQVSFTDVTHP
jgi:hypothetical protein